MKKNLLITYDYELFLGNRSGCIADCLLKPTYQTLSILETYQATGIFFVDTTYLMQLKNKIADYPVCKKDFDSIVTQLQEIIKAGHYIFPHLHPHWIDAVYLPESNEWRLNDISKYRFHNISQSQRALVFDGSMDLLNQIIFPVKPDYLIDCYRAGGWCIQPFEDFKSYFEKHHIKYDMSVLSEFYLFSDTQFFDFSACPKKNIYRFENDVVVENRQGNFTQYTISSIYINQMLGFFDKVWLKYLYKIKGDHTFTRGQGQVAVKTDMQKPNSITGHDILSAKKERVAIELLTAVKLPAYLKYMRQNDYMHFISHPKMLTQHNHKIFKAFLQKVYNEFEIETDFKKMALSQ